MANKKAERRVKHRKSLTNRQKRFVNYLIKGLTQEKAYIKAGYAPKRARANSSKLKAKENIKAELKKRERRSEKLADVSRANTLREYARIAFFDIRKFYNNDGTLKTIHELDDDTAAALVSIEVTNTPILGEFTKKIKMGDKLKALEDLAKMLGMFEKDNKQRSGSFAETFSNLLNEIDGKTANLNIK